MLMTSRATNTWRSSDIKVGHILQWSRRFIHKMGLRVKQPKNPSRVALGNRRLKWYWPMTSNGQERSSGFNRVKTKRTKLEFSGWHLRPYILEWHSMYVHVCIGSTDESQHRLSMWQHVLGACIKHSCEMEGKWNMRQPHGGGRMEEKKRRT